MSIWMDATIHLHAKNVDPTKNPKQGILAVLKKHGLDVEKPNSEMKLRGLDKLNYDLSICNPEGYVDQIHAAFKELVKYPYILGVTIKNHHYF